MKERSRQRGREAKQTQRRGRHSAGRQVCTTWLQGLKKILHFRTSASTATTGLPCFPAPSVALVLGLVDSICGVIVVAIVVAIAFVALSVAAEVAVQLGEKAAEVDGAATFARARLRSLHDTSRQHRSTSRASAGREARDVEK